MAISLRPAAAAASLTRQQRRVVFGSSIGTVFEWYDFYVYGALAPVIARQFFSALDSGAAFIFTLLGLAAGFVVRPFGALIFGRLGDLIGRKYTFIVSILVMGLATFMIGLLPSHQAIGVAAPVVLIGLRLLQGLALGGEYGGAAVYVAEHAPPQRRGYYTAWIQTTASLGLLLALLVVVGTRRLLGDAAFEDWGWRVPFLISIGLLVLGLWVRLALSESPVFRRMVDGGGTSRAPVRESFFHWGNLRWVLVALFGLTAGQAVVWYTGQLYVLYFLTQTLKVDADTASLLLAASLAIGAPFFVAFGALSDRIGRKPVIMAGCLLAAAGYFPLFQALTEAANPALAQASREVPVVLQVDPKRCSFQGSPVARETDFRSPCDIGRRALAQAGIDHVIEARTAIEPQAVRIGAVEVPVPDALPAPDGTSFSAESRAELAAFRRMLEAELRRAGYPERADPARIDSARVIGILSLLVLFVTMVYGPIAAILVELFPTRIRYTSVSLPYHLGNGWFGGLLPALAFGMVAQSGSMLQGLWYPVIVAGATFVIGMLFVPETLGTDIDAEPAVRRRRA